MVLLPERVTHRFEMGAVLVESAIVVAAVLTFVFGMIQIAGVGLEQLTIDGAAFLNAHQTVIGVKDVNGANDATSKVFPNVKPTSFLGKVIAVAPAPAVPVDYGYNGSPAEQANSAANHVGGASIIQPYVLQTSIKQRIFTFMGVAVNAYATASEQEYLESNLNYGVDNLNYGLSGSSALYRNSMFAYGENAAPYFGSWANIQECDNAPAWITPTCVNQSYYQDPLSIFPAQYGPREDSMGMAESLQTLNWDMGGLGISGPVCATNSCGTTGPFEAMACHQRFFSAIATFVSTYSDLNAIETSYNPMYYNAVNSPSGGVQFFGQKTAFATSKTMPLNFAANVVAIYGWDRSSLNAYSTPNNGVNQLNPTVGCT
jgi:hypothetical protein